MTFEYRGQNLFAEGVPVRDIAREAGTPVYIYSETLLKENFRSFDRAYQDVPHLVCYALKANSSLAVARTFAKEGAGADIVSGGELFRALHAGFDPKKIIFSGVGKTADEIRFALNKGVLMLNVESMEELAAISDVARSMKKKAPISIRVNPDVEADTHHHITTGKAENKFGIHKKSILAAYRAARGMKNVEILGLQAHIGSQITSVTPFSNLMDVLLGLTDSLEKDGIRLRYLDLGGGLGIPYREEKTPPPSAIAAALVPKLKERDMTLIFEPGRFLVGNAGILITKVVYRKMGSHKNFLIVDAGMNDLARPALYDAYHGIIPVQKRGRKNVTADIVGPICESGDYFAKGRRIEMPDQKDCLAILSAGAYGFSMSSQYNSRPRAAEVMVSGKNWRVVRKRENYEDLIHGEK